MNEDYDYDEYDRPQIPTFSDGSYAVRGSKMNASISRTSASNDARAIASRASARVMTNLQSINNNNQVVWSTHHQNIPRANTNNTAIRVAEQRAQYLVMAAEYNKLQETLQREHEMKQHLLNHYIKEEIELRESMMYKEILNMTRLKKNLLLQSYEAKAPTTIKRYPNVNLVQSNTPTDVTVDPSLLSLLSENLANILKIEPNNKEEILNEYNRHNLRVRNSTEESHYKTSIDNSRLNKSRYFTSDI